MRTAYLPATLALLLAACAPNAGTGPAAPGAPVAPAASGAPAAAAPAFPPDGYPEPPVLRSQDGVLTATLTAAPITVMVGGKPVSMLAYNGAIPGPTLRVRPGDKLRLTLVNQLGEATNFHTHGLHVSPSGIADNVLRTMAPGSTSAIEIDIPKDHPAGTHWYHPHMHGKTTDQVRAGLAGVLVVEGADDELPGLTGIRDRTVILQEVQVGENGKPVSIYDAAADFSKFTRFVNGKQNPEIPIAPGETQRWRVLNASGSTFYRLKVDGHRLTQVSDDGNILKAAVGMDDVKVAPGERVDVLITGGAAGKHTLRTLEVPAGFDVTPALDLATVVSAGAAQPARPQPTALRPYEDLRGLPVASRRTITLSNTHPGPGEQIAFLIDGKAFDHARIDVVGKLGTVDEWTIENATTDEHPFHIHTNPFQVVAVNGVPYDAPGLADTNIVPKMDEAAKKNGSITFRTRYTDYTGRLVYHCHILEHEDRGMMGLMDITVDGKPLPIEGH